MITIYQASIQNYRGHMPLKSYLFGSAWDGRATWCRNPSQPNGITKNLVYTISGAFGMPH